MRRDFKPGDPVIYHLSKSSRRPGPRAHYITPAAHGDTYSYVVDKFWRVKDVTPEGRLLLVTRRGKVRLADPDDPMLEKPGIWEGIKYRHRFPKADQTLD